MGRFAGWLLAVLVAVAPGAGISTAAAPSATRTFARSGIRFQYPAGWTVSPPAWAYSSEYGYAGVAFLSPQPMRDPCVTRGNSTTCGPPVDALRPGGLLVTLATSGVPGRPSFRSGTPIEVGGRTGYVAVERPGSCSEVEGDMTLTASIPISGTNAYTVQACMRQPTAANERRVRALLATLRLR